MKFTPIRYILLICLLLTFSSSGFAVQGRFSVSKHDTLKIFIIGNSFSGNATTYLPQLAKEGGHIIKFGRAELGGCSLKQHWDGVVAAEANADDVKGKIYKGKSMKELLAADKWDIVTIQQYSRLSSSVATYEPYISNLYEFIKKQQPKARIVLHETWAYRRDAKQWGLITEKEEAANDEQMHEKLKANYLTFAGKLHTGIIPTGEAFWIMRNNRSWAYQPVSEAVVKAVVYPEIPPQPYSLNMGYYWLPDKTLKFDPNHANVAGCYLGSLVWYHYLFGGKLKKVKYKPAEVSDEFAAQLKKAATSAFKVSGF
ncbi:DUF4886 domain-containing protein [Mucilaginibacter sp. PAMB04168]|uniref:DUF4886 domain-containing protein n=1 Tax=Mucilaginibacter sp. PAMB04168 TaxID=3138567 RepID=UPI0031F60F62